MTATPYRAVIAGATGAVGGALTRALLASPACTAVVAVARRPFTSLDDAPGRDKLAAVVTDYADLEEATARAGAGCAAAFCTVGIGQPRKVSAEVFWRVDVEYAAAFARGAARAGAGYIGLLSAIGANARSSNRYIRVKGKAEQAVIDAGIARTAIFRPSVLVTRDIRYGLQDRLTQALFPLVAPLLPRRLHQVRVEDLGLAMQRDAERAAPPGVAFLYYPDYVELLASPV
jgi:uncharacterized protein YbjT (DUF2867 family)